MKDVWVASGVRDSDAVWDVWGRGWMPRACVAGVCVRNENGASPFVVPLVAFAGEVEDRGSRFGSGLGWRSARSLAICASLRFFSAARAALSFWVSMSLRRNV